jgi:hypothetical protein
MKRFLFLMLALSILLTCFTSCGASLPSEPAVTEETVESTTEDVEEKRDPTGFAAGFARVEITPKTSVGMAGYGNTAFRRSTVIEDDLTVSCTAVSDGENTALLFSVDVIGLSAQNCDHIYKQIEKNLGIAPEFVLINATHCHSGPDVASTSDDSIANYMRIFYPAFLKAAKDAIADLDRCEMKIGSGTTTNLNYVRRCFKEDGSFIADCVINLSSAPVVRHETDADNEMQLLMFDRANGKDILLMNWQCHVTSAGGRDNTMLSPDFVGALRDKMEKEAGVHFAYHQGAAANIEPNSYIESEPDHRDYKEHGGLIAQVALEAMRNMEQVPVGKIRAVKKTVTCDHDLDVSGYNLTEAQQITDLKNSDQFVKAKTLCIEYGYNSPYHASAVISRSRRTETASTLDISALAIGDVGFAVAPYEMFDTNGMQIKENSPYTMTFVCAYSNGRYGYIPSSIAWEAGGYEVDTCKYVKGTGEMLANELVGLLNELK